MKALTWHGRGDVRCDTVPDPIIENQRDAIIKVTSCAICGSDLHLVGGFVPKMESGDILGHECMGEVVDVGRDVKDLKIGDRVVIPFNISCGECRMCKMELWSCCERSNPNGKMQAETMGYPVAGAFGYSHLTGGFAGGQAEYLRVPYADVGPYKVPKGIDDEKLLFLSDIFPTGYMAAEFCEITPQKTIAVFGCGPVAQFAIKSCFLLGAERVIAIDSVPERLAMARENGAETIDTSDGPVQEQIIDKTQGRGPDATIDAVGMESHGTESTFERMTSAVKSAVIASERTYALNEAIIACRPGGIVSMVGVYIGSSTPTAMGAFMNKGLTMKAGQTPVKRYLDRLMGHIEKGEIDLSSVITHRSTNLDDGPDLYETFRDKEDGCIKVIFRPND